MNKYRPFIRKTVNLLFFDAEITNISLLSCTNIIINIINMKLAFFYICKMNKYRPFISKTINYF